LQSIFFLEKSTEKMEMTFLGQLGRPDMEAREGNPQRSNPIYCFSGSINMPTCDRVFGRFFFVYQVHYKAVSSGIFSHGFFSF
jgi:hypothetical protein